MYIYLLLNYLVIADLAVEQTENNPNGFLVVDLTAVICIKPASFLMVQITCFDALYAKLWN